MFEMKKYYFFFFCLIFYYFKLFIFIGKFFYKGLLGVVSIFDIKILFKLLLRFVFVFKFLMVLIVKLVDKLFFRDLSNKFVLFKDDELRNFICKNELIVLFKCLNLIRD